MMHLFCATCRTFTPYPGPDGDTADMALMPEHLHHHGAFFRVEETDDAERMFNAWWGASVRGHRFDYEVTV